MRFASLLALCTIAAIVLLTSPAFASSTATQTVTYSFSLTGASYDGGGGTPTIDGLGGIEVDELFTEIGSGTRGGAATVLVNGVAPLDPEEFVFGVGDTIEATIVTEAEATSPVSIWGQGFDVLLFFDFEDLANPSQNVLLNFDWSYTREYSLTNMAAGDKAAANLFSAGLITNLSAYSDTVFTVDDTNENTAAGTVVMTPSDSGSFQFLMDTEGGSAPQSYVEYTINAGSSAHVLVPEPSLLAILAPVGLFAAVAAYRRRRC